ncbi:uncharacterized protein LOC121068030 isoform X2 [Cygnus olor]|uniref:uncharacterized protein LOC121068030 isoform X2 n=1 Tax=Cygnus olor TaxID=8869 RepID=UPI001ADEABAD|nr:uncharacterized protein LOC121068030 isoform X2 [Cygnus olor]
MKPLPLLVLLVLVPLAWGPAPRELLSPPCGAAGAAPGGCGSCPEHQDVKPGAEFPWVMAYASMRSCHRVLRDAYGEFSPPAYCSDSPMNFWCNWTIWAGSRKHIIIYIQGFTTKEGCNKNEDKILFEGVSSLVENSVVYACWKKEMHVFATFARAVHVVLLKRYVPNCRDSQFKGKYFTFQDGKGESPSSGASIPKTLSPELSKPGGIFEPGWAEDPRDVLGFGTTDSTESFGATAVLHDVSPQGRGTAESPNRLVPYRGAEIPLLETKAARVPGSEPPAGLRLCEEDQCGGMARGGSPTAGPGSWQQGPATSGDVSRFSSVPSETPLLGALQGAEPFLQPTGMGQEGGLSVLHSSLRLGDVGSSQPTIKPTHTTYLDVAARSRALSSGRRESQDSVDATTYQGLDAAGLEENKRQEEDKSHGAARGDADGLAKGLTPSLSTLYQVVRKDSSQMPPERSQSSFEGLSTTQPDLETTSLQHTKLMGISPPEIKKIPTPALSHHDHVPAGFGSGNFTPKDPLSSQVEAVSRAASPLAAALGLDPVRRRAGTPPPVPGGQEVFSPSPPRHPSAAPALGTDVSPGPLGLEMSKRVLEEGGQQEETLAPAGLPDRGPSVASIPSLRPITGLPCPQHQKTTEGFRASAGEQRNASLSHHHSGSPVAPQGQTVLQGQELQQPSSDPLSRKTWMPGGQRQQHAELGLPWATEYFPARSCHVVFQGGFGMFYLPPHGDIKANIWCNWTIWAGPQKHVVIYVQGFQGSEGCGKNQDKMIFQGVLSSVETKVVYACHNRGTLIFATRAIVVHVLFLSGGGSLSSEYKHFKGQYYVFGDYESVGSSNEIIAPGEPVQESWRTAVTKDFLPMLRASPSPSAVPPADRFKPEFISSDEKDQHLPDLAEDAQPGASLGKHGELQDETKMERSLQDGGTEGEESDNMLVAPARGDAGCEAEQPPLEAVKGDVGLVSALVTVAPRSSPGVSSSEVPSSTAGLSDSSSLGQASGTLEAEVVTTHRLPMLEKPPLNTSTGPSPLYPSPGVTAGGMVSPQERHEDLFDLDSVLASLENSTALQSLHHPGDVLFEVTTEIKHEEWISLGGSELRKDLIESLKNSIQQNLKLSANRVNEIKLKEVRRTTNASLLLTFWLHLKPQERNMSLLLHSQLEELLGASVGVEKLQLVSLLVEDVNECSSGVSLCGEEAECFNGVGTYLCRCKKGYEDRSPTKSGTLCVRAPTSGLGKKDGDVPSVYPSAPQTN